MGTARDLGVGQPMIGARMAMGMVGIALGSTAPPASAQTVAGVMEMAPVSARVVASAPTWAPAHNFTWRVQADPCADTAGVIRDLTRWPEGLAIVRMRRDLDAAERLTEITGRSLDAPDAQSIVVLRRAVESLASELQRSPASPTPAGTRASTSGALVERQVLLGRVRALSSDVNAVVEQSARAQPMSAGTPRGYMGVTLSSASVREAAQRGYAVSYCAYPVVEAVDPGSPAARAGLEAGDTVVSFDGRDVVAVTVDYAELLEPGRTVRVGVRRGARERTIGVEVVPRTTQSITVRRFVRDGPSAFAFTPSTSGVLGSAPRVTRAPMVSETQPTALRLFGIAGRGPLARMNGADDAMLGGAQLKTLSEELRQALNQPEGVLVLDVLLGTPAAEGGLRAGDIIRTANGSTVRRVADVLRVFEQVQTARAFPMRVVRGDAPERTVTMRW